MTRVLAGLRRNTSGVAAIEFALVAFPMIFTFFGVAEVANYILAARKVSNVASAAADLVTQEAVVNDSDMAEIMSALNVVLHPFKPEEAKIRITSVVADDKGKLTVAWSDARNTNALTPGSSVTGVPAGIVPNGQGIIMTEVSFTYTSFFGMYLTSGMTVSDTFYLKPRRSTTVERL
jgi:Flp pilus assembly protein TadG